jgi:hypothetical protein
MNDIDIRRHRTFIRSREFTAQSIDDFVEGGAVRAKYAQLQRGITNFEQKAAAHGAAMSDAHQGTSSISEARDDLEDRLRLMRGVAKVFGLVLPRVPQGNDQELLQMADIYLAKATPLKAEFIAHQMPADFLERLAEEKAALQSALVERANAVGDHISAREDLDHAGDEVMAIIRDLAPMMKVTYANNPGKLAEWTAASHLERPARKSKGGGETPPTPTG